MTISSLPAATSQPVNSTTVGIAVLAKSLDTIEQSGQSMIQMMEKSVSPNLGQNIDMRVQQTVNITIKNMTMIILYNHCHIMIHNKIIVANFPVFV